MFDESTTASMQKNLKNHDRNLSLHSQRLSQSRNIEEIRPATAERSHSGKVEHGPDHGICQICLPRSMSLGFGMSISNSTPSWHDTRSYRVVAERSSPERHSRASWSITCLIMCFSHVMFWWRTCTSLPHSAISPRLPHFHRPVVKFSGT